MTTPTPNSRTVVTNVDTPAGALRLAERVGANGESEIVALAFADHFDRVAARLDPEDWVEGDGPGAGAVRRYVAGDLAAIDELGVCLQGTAFQERVWQTLRSIPAGSTWSYAELADAVGSPAAVRAVGTANGANPVWLVVPCHRVVRSDGSLGGYGGGLDRKRWLLEHEGVTVR